MDNVQNLDSNATTSTLTKSPLNILQYARQPNPKEEAQGPNGTWYYCALPGCTYRSDVATNFRRHLRTKHSLHLPAKPSTILEQSQEELESMFVNLGLESRAAFESTVFTDHLQKSLSRTALIHMIIRNRLPLSLVEQPSFHTFLATLNPEARNIIPVSHSTIKSDVINEWDSIKQQIKLELQKK